MSARMAIALLLVLLLAPPPARAQRLDWDPAEAEAGVLVTVLRHKRDGLLGLLDDVTDLQLAVFAELSLLSGSVLMLFSDGVGLLDDNPLSEHVTRAIASKALAKTAYLFHLAGAEAVLGSHGLDTSWYLQGSLVQLNPLLDPAESEPRFPLEPLDFVEDALFHPAPLIRRVPGSILASALLADGVLRPAANLLLFCDQPGASRRLEQLGQRLVAGALP